MSLSIWLVAGIVPGVERQPLKKLAVDESALLKLLHRWREEAAKAGHRIKRITVAFEAGRDGFWLARWLGARDIEAHVIHGSSVAVSREHRRAKTDRLDTELFKRSFLGWLRGERDHCKMVAIPTTKRSLSLPQGAFASAEIAAETIYSPIARECEEHGWMQDRADPACRRSCAPRRAAALLQTRLSPKSATPRLDQCLLPGVSNV